MSKPTKTEIYEDKTFFGDYLETTSEKDYFADAFIKKIGESQVTSLLDLGCFDGSLTRKLISKLQQAKQTPAKITVVEPASLPLKEFEQHIKSENRSGDWQFVNSGMEAYLKQNEDVFDWTIVSHSLYWVGDEEQIFVDIFNSARNGAIVIRDPGVMHQVEKKFRPRMTNKKKRFISSQEIRKILDAKSLSYQSESFFASMKVSGFDTLEFKQLAGFLLDLKLEELDESLLKELHSDLHVVKGQSVYGIDIIWFGEVLLK